MLVAHEVELIRTVTSLDESACCVVEPAMTMRTRKSFPKLRLSGVVVITPVCDCRFEPGLNQVESEIMCVSYAVSFHE